MASLEIYYGSIDVDSDEYLAAVYDEEQDDFEDKAIEGLDDIVVPFSSVDFSLEYPFQRPYNGRITGDAGITLRQIVDAIRSGFRTMYRGASHAPIAGLPGNELVQGGYGQAFHGIHDLVIEGIVFHEEERRLQIYIGS